MSVHLLMREGVESSGLARHLLKAYLQHYNTPAIYLRFGSFGALPIGSNITPPVMWINNLLYSPVPIAAKEAPSINIELHVCSAAHIPHTSAGRQHCKGAICKGVQSCSASPLLQVCNSMK